MSANQTTEEVDELQLKLLQMLDEVNAPRGAARRPAPAAHAPSSPNPSSAGQQAPANQAVKQPVSGATCKNCDNTDSWGQSPWCPKCGFYPKLNRVVAEMDNGQDDQPVEEINLLSLVPGWGWVVGVGILAMIIESTLVRVFVHDVSTRGSFALFQIFVGLTTFLIAHGRAYMIAVFTSDKISPASMILAPMKIWNEVFKVLPKSTGVVKAGSWGVSAMLLGLVVVGLDWNALFKPQTETKVPPLNPFKWIMQMAVSVADMQAQAAANNGGGGGGAPGLDGLPASGDSMEDALNAFAGSVDANILSGAVGGGGGSGGGDMFGSHSGGGGGGAIGGIAAVAGGLTGGGGGGAGGAGLGGLGGGGASALPGIGSLPGENSKTSGDLTESIAEFGSIAGVSNDSAPGGIGTSPSSGGGISNFLPTGGVGGVGTTTGTGTGSFIGGQGSQNASPSNTTPDKSEPAASGTVKTVKQPGIGTSTKSSTPGVKVVSPISASNVSLTTSQPGQNSTTGSAETAAQPASLTPPPMKNEPTGKHRTDKTLFTIFGYTKNANGDVRSLLIADIDEQGRGRFMGRISTGSAGEDMYGALTAELAKIHVGKAAVPCPYSAQWVDPVIQCQVAHDGLTIEKRINDGELLGYQRVSAPE